MTNRSLRAFLPAALCSAILIGVAGPRPAAHGVVVSTAYGWPVKPFDRPHPVRGSFGDPRTIFAGPPTAQTLATGAGDFAFHFGIDIAAADGTAVYPVESGRVSEVHDDWLEVDSGRGRAFEYRHVAAAARTGQWVTAQSTVLGHILRGCEHVHLSELDEGAYVNPLALGHLEPYTDTTRPVVHSIALTTSGGETVMPEFVRGRIELLAESYDTPQLSAPAEWAGLPVTPALVEWWIVKAEGGKVIVPRHVTYDVRSHTPADHDFWCTYARGTHQNMSVFGKHYSYMQPGRYVFRLAPTGLDTTRLQDEVYDLVVKATDTRGNTGSLTLRFSVHNRPGDVGV